MAEEKKRPVGQIKDLAVGAVTDPTGTAKKAAGQAKSVAEQATKVAAHTATEVAAAALTTATRLMPKRPDGLK